jgi:hypothetical protein
MSKSGHFCSVPYAKFCDSSLLTFGFLGTKLDTTGWYAVTSSGRIPQLLVCPQLQMIEDVHTTGTHGGQSVDDLSI